MRIKPVLFYQTLNEIRLLPGINPSFRWRQLI
jgi:hypothetical protein